jgi:hypothetical protein
MPGYPNVQPVDSRQLAGTEYGGVQPTLAGGIQPKPSGALDNGELLRLGYLTGNEFETRRDISLEDRRQMMGLLPAEGGRPVWLEKVNPEDDIRRVSEAELQGYGPMNLHAPDEAP